jgi:polysaccharide biosynthesis protein VpsQ
MKWWYLFSAFTAFIILVIVGAYADIIPTSIAVVPMYDSVGHFGLYGLWVFLLHQALKHKTKAGVPIAFLVLFPIVALEELAQTLASTRTFSVYDLIWGFAGMVTFLVLSKILTRLNIKLSQ